ncbi:hypothetical protein WOLCODRAFT_157328 [Wolfiporia cocos MD-104 SS10]|uniref:Uncharacterized protein n=1 Tax=Wolfiporia cocos (strain MD-104) TaxID=742152 RepID=A0A2H3J4N5_WOLCO|nr:hypothetical protein WOLCODRAFT_157328 [Wolfiporia cocos MD-104 SS10]
MLIMICAVSPVPTGVTHSNERVPSSIPWHAALLKMENVVRYRTVLSPSVVLMQARRRTRQADDLAAQLEVRSRAGACSRGHSAARKCAVLGTTHAGVSSLRDTLRKLTIDSIDRSKLKVVIRRCYREWEEIAISFRENIR